MRGIVAGAVVRHRLHVGRFRVLAVRGEYLLLRSGELVLEVLASNCHRIGTVPWWGR